MAKSQTQLLLLGVLLMPVAQVMALMVLGVGLLSLALATGSDLQPHAMIYVPSVLLVYLVPFLLLLDYGAVLPYMVGMRAVGWLSVRHVLIVGLIVSTCISFSVQLWQLGGAIEDFTIIHFLACATIVGAPVFFGFIALAAMLELRSK